MGFRRGTLVLLAVTTVLLGGCAGVDDPAISPSPSSSTPPTPPAASPTPTPEPTPTPLPTAAADPSDTAVPGDCDALLSTGLISETLGEPWLPAEPQAPFEFLPGPTAQEAAVGARAALSCRWWPEAASEGSLIGAAFELDADVRADLVAQLEAAPSYASFDVESAEVAYFLSELRGDLRYTTVYAFVGDVWIVLIAPLYEVVLSTFVEEVAANVRVG